MLQKRPFMTISVNKNVFYLFSITFGVFPSLLAHFGSVILAAVFFRKHLLKCPVIAVKFQIAGSSFTISLSSCRLPMFILHCQDFPVCSSCYIKYHTICGKMRRCEIVSPTVRLFGFWLRHSLQVLVKTLSYQTEIFSMKSDFAYKMMFDFCQGNIPLSAQLHIFLCVCV